MKDGYYISAYCCIDEEGCILHAQMRHDQTIALWQLHGQKLILVKYWELERYTRLKQHMRSFLDRTHFEFMLVDLLEEVSLHLEDITAIFGMPEYGTLTVPDTMRSMPFHSVWHIFSGLIHTEEQFQEDLLVLAMDGGPDNVSDNGFDHPYHYLAAFFHGGTIAWTEPIESPAYLWTEASELFCLREGTLMALAEACSCTYDGITELDPFPFYSMHNIPAMRQEFKRVWNQISHAELSMDACFTEEENRISCFMKVIQNTSQSIVHRNLERLIAQHELEPNRTILTLTGGFALNCPTNSWIMKTYKFRKFISPPCVNDSGIALGIGLCSFYQELENRLVFELGNAFHGYEEHRDFGVCFRPLIKTEQIFDPAVFAVDIETSPVCWFEGAAEIGPRALGHRSLLGSAASEEMKKWLNEVKQREWWRPVAPVVLEDAAEEWFGAQENSPYMLRTFFVHPNKKHAVPAVLHLNDSARIQTIGQQHTLYAVLQQYQLLTGIPMICNTSLNDKGEPIINTYEELVAFAMKKRLHILYVEGRRYELRSGIAPPMNPDFFHVYLMQHGGPYEQKYAGLEIDEEDLDYYVNHKSYFPPDVLFRSDFREWVENVKEQLHETLPS